MLIVHNCWYLFAMGIRKYREILTYKKIYELRLQTFTDNWNYLFFYE